MGRGQPSEERLAGLFPTSPVIKQRPLMHVQKEGEKEKRISKPEPSDYCLPPRGAQKYIVHLIEAYKSLKNIYKIIEGNGNHLFK